MDTSATLWHLVFILLSRKVVCSVRTKRFVPNQGGYICDDGEHGISIDLHDDADWKCMEENKWPIDESSRSHKQCYEYERAYHVCIDQPIDNLYSSDIPHSGPHRKVWAQYGEYRYLPPGRYVHNLEHGGVVFMYHPCAPTEMVAELRRIATSCLYRYVLTAFPKLTMEYPFAAITYGCIFRMSTVNQTEIKSWIRSYFGKSPEADVFGNGLYNFGLLVPSIQPTKLPTDSSEFCPDVPEEIIPTPSIQYPEYTEPLDTTKENELYTDMITEQQTSIDSVSTVSSDNDKVRQENVPSDGYFGLLLVATGAVFLVIGLTFRTCLSSMRNSGKQKNRSLRLWRDDHSPDPFSVAAVIRNFPRTLLGEKSEGDQKYHRIEPTEQSSDEDNTV